MGRKLRKINRLSSSPKCNIRINGFRTAIRIRINAAKIFIYRSSSRFVNSSANTREQTSPQHGIFIATTGQTSRSHVANDLARYSTSCGLCDRLSHARGDRPSHIGRSSAYNRRLQDIACIPALGSSHAASNHTCTDGRSDCGTDGPQADSGRNTGADGG